YPGWIRRPGHGDRIAEEESRKGDARAQAWHFEERLREKGQKPQAGGCDRHVRIRSVKAAQKSQLIPVFHVLGADPVSNSGAAAGAAIHRMIMIIRAAAAKLPRKRRVLRPACCCRKPRAPIY